ncbi:hypothetical protein PSTG_09963 [Puccinia striiformis f. sp. tritici PST-78]|uniref:Secreted protein n=1 Tax=Puccinia striiformis f. sp. tritici PST-78 TaxID=1165861 RepID=A0A0L0VC30_9BASI|nr:hypothetical protein PSTG_09963 [Puccinia striiformis f. sp. tritici PST-78]
MQFPTTTIVLLAVSGLATAAVPVINRFYCNHDQPHGFCGVKLQNKQWFMERSPLPSTAVASEKATFVAMITWFIWSRTKMAPPEWRTTKNLTITALCNRYETLDVNNNNIQHRKYNKFYVRTSSLYYPRPIGVTE